MVPVWVKEEEKQTGCLLCSLLNTPGTFQIIVHILWNLLAVDPHRSLTWSYCRKSWGSPWTPWWSDWSLVPLPVRWHQTFVCEHDSLWPGGGSSESETTKNRHHLLIDSITQTFTSLSGQRPRTSTAFQEDVDWKFYKLCCNDQDFSFKCQLCSCFSSSLTIVVVNWYSLSYNVGVSCFATRWIYTFMVASLVSDSKQIFCYQWNGYASACLVKRRLYCHQSMV